ncbi:hypothetical protein [Hwanghaeella grinnelliae]|nr:hypothetical protein [Hwanghaeella grinnelliae]
MSFKSFAASTANIGKDKTDTKATPATEAQVDKPAAKQGDAAPATKS